MTIESLIIVSVRGGIVQEVRSNRAVLIIVEDWDTPDHRPSWEELAYSPLTTEDRRAMSQDHS
jgi:hypothetical protein